MDIGSPALGLRIWDFRVSDSEWRLLNFGSGVSNIGVADLRLSMSDLAYKIFRDELLDLCQSCGCRCGISGPQNGVYRAQKYGNKNIDVCVCLGF